MEENITKYSFWRIKRILKKDYDCRIENIWQGYKANRRPNYVEKYNLINNETDVIIFKGVTLNTLRLIFTQEGYPLHDEDK